MPDQVQKRKPNSELLNIREAANFLHVSEVSLRRWTNAGKLPCLRVGGRKERRFRRDDLVAFLDSDSKRSSIRQASDEPSPGPVMIEDFAIERGAHLCSFYKSDLGRLKLSVSFLAAGLADGDGFSDGEEAENGNYYYTFSANTFYKDLINKQGAFVFIK